VGFAAWLRALDAVGGLIEVGRRLRGDSTPAGPIAPGAYGPGQLEARLAGVVVAALKEAFDRDRARLDLERADIEAERRRAEEALRLELERQAADRAIAHVRLVALMGFGVWLASALLSVWLEGMREGLPRLLLAGGWAALIATLAAAFSAYSGVALKREARAATLAQWLLMVGLTLTAASLIAAL
jgi:hypothetical protein